MKKLMVLGVIFMFLLVNAALYGAGWGKSSPAAADNTGSEISAKKQTETAEKKDEDPTVYVKEKGKKYHKKNCKIVKEGKIGIKLSEAIKKGYEPCAVCKPPTKKKKKK